MAYTNIPLQAETDGALVTVPVDTTNGHKYFNDGNRRLLLLNPDEDELTITPVIPSEAEDDLADSNNIDPPAVTTDDAQRIFRAYEPRLYNRRSGADVNCMTFTVSGTTSTAVFAVV